MRWAPSYPLESSVSWEDVLSLPLTSPVHRTSILNLSALRSLLSIHLLLSGWVFPSLPAFCPCLCRLVSGRSQGEPVNH